MCVPCSRMENSDSGRAEEEVRERSSRLVSYLELCGTFSVMSFWWLETVVSFCNEFLVTWWYSSARPCPQVWPMQSPFLFYRSSLLSSPQPVVLQERCGWLHNPSFNWTNRQKHLCSWKYGTSVCTAYEVIFTHGVCQPVSLRHHWTKFCVVWLSQLTHELKESWVEFLSLETGELESLWSVCLLKALWWCQSQIRTWAFVGGVIFSLTRKPCASKNIWLHLVIKVPSFDDRALCCLLPLHLILSSFPDISWSSFLPSHLSPSVHQRNLSITSRPELGWPGLNTAFFCCQCEFLMAEWSSFKIYYVISCSKKWIWVAFSNLRVLTETKK